MTITVTGCNSIDIVDDLLVNYLDDAEGRTLTLEFYSNCCSTSSNTITLTEDDIDVNTYSFLPDTLGLTVFTDGVYNFKLRLTESNGSYEEHVACAVVMCNLECDVLAYLVLHPKDIVMSNLLETLRLATSCDDCACEIVCDAYKTIISLIKKSNIETNVSTDCGC